MKQSFQQIFFPYDKNGERFKTLDGLRGLAILFVLLSHSSNENIYFVNLNFQGIGKTGVYLFFVLSAYLLDRQIALALMSGKAGKLFWLNYFMRRILRIYPLFVIGLFVFAFVSSTAVDTGIHFSSSIPLHLLLIQSKSIFWSIAVEFKYYFISPLFLIFCHRVLRWKPMPTLVFFISLITLAVILRNKLPLDSTILFLPVFLIGTMISVYELLVHDKTSIRKYGSLIETAGLISFLLILFSTPHYFQKITGLEPRFLDPVLLLPFGILWGIVLVSARYGAGILKFFFNLAILRFLGIISFSLYIFHIPVLIFVDTGFLHIPAYLKVEAFFFFAILVSTISYLLIERPLSRIRLYRKPLKEEDINLEPKSSFTSVET